MIFRGAIYEIEAIPGARRHEQRGHRNCVIVQSDRFSSSSVIVALTSTSAGPAIFRPEIEFEGSRTLILVDQIFSVSPDRFGAFKGSLDGPESAALDRALMLKLGLI